MTDEQRNPIQWQLTGSAGAVRSGQAYGLKNKEVGQSLVYGKRDNGINLVWDARNVGANITLVRAAGAVDVIKHGEFVAIRVKGGKYVKYQRRTVGVNLGWSDSPVPEWQLIGEKLGERVNVGQAFALKNKVEDDLLVYAVREFGINLRWDKDYQLIGDRTLTDAILDLGFDAAMKDAESRGIPPVITKPVGGVVKELV